MVQLARAADAHGQVVFVIHWFSGLYDTEEFLAEPGESVTSIQLRSGSRTFAEDRLVWVSGRNSGKAVA
jgi:hypothetical protein